MADSVERSVTCKQCGSRLEVPADEMPESRRPGPDCGATQREISVEIRATATGRAGVGRKLGPAQRVGRRKYSREEYDFPAFRRADGTLVRRYTLIDRINDWYEECVTTEDGEVIHCCKERLSKHYGHGSARNKKGKGKP